jgi:hypothetical protein
MNSNPMVSDFESMNLMSQNQALLLLGVVCVVSFILAWFVLRKKTTSFLYKNK